METFAPPERKAVAATAGPWLWSQHWRDLLFAHWPVAAADLRPHVPAALEIDTHDGTAWVSVVAFRLERIRRRWLPAIGFLTDGLELNLRTYVCYQGERAICFLSIHAGKPLLVHLARWATPLPYQFARMSYTRRHESRRFQAHTTGPGDLLTAEFNPLSDSKTVQPGSLDDWLLERYCLYAQDRNGILLRTVVEHPPWPVQAVTARIAVNTTGRPFGLDLSDVPTKVHFSAGVHARLWPFCRPRPDETPLEGFTTRR